MSKKSYIESKLPKEAIMFAKSMGLSLDGLEPEAEDIWRMLDDLSNKDPIQYQEFVSQQFQSQKEASESSDDNKRSFRPTAGFAIETSTIDGDGIKIREIEGSNNVTGKKLYVNLCSSIVIEAPIDKFGKAVVDNITVADGLSIPLVVGTTREETDRILAIDVVFHPKVLELANKEKYFKKQISDLALDWVIKESGLKCNTNWDYCSGNTSSSSSSYRCGRGANKDLPVLFFVPVDEKGEPTTNSYSDRIGSKGSETLANTSKLLSEIKKDRNVTSTNPLSLNDNNTIKITNPSKETIHDKKQSTSHGTLSATEIKQKVLIQELDGSSSIASNEDLVDLSKSTINDQANNEGLENNISLTNQKDIPIENDLTKVSKDNITKESKVKIPSKKEYSDMEKLLTTFDDEFSNTLGMTDQNMQIESANTMISELAKILTVGAAPGLLSVTTPSPTNYPQSCDTMQRIMKDLVIQNYSNSLAEFCVKVEQSTLNKDSLVLVMTLSELSSNLDTSLIELLVSPKEALIKIPEKYIINVSNKNSAHESKNNVTFKANYIGTLCNFNELHSSASFKKKKGILQIKINLNIQ